MIAASLAISIDLAITISVWPSIPRWQLDSGKPGLAWHIRSGTHTWHMHTHRVNNPHSIRWSLNKRCDSVGRNFWLIPHHYLIYEERPRQQSIGDFIIATNTFDGINWTAFIYLSTEMETERVSIVLSDWLQRKRGSANREAISQRFLYVALTTSISSLQNRMQLCNMRAARSRWLPNQGPV
jgi:hypothetical protein